MDRHKLRPMVANPLQVPKVEWQIRKDEWLYLKPIERTAGAVELAVCKPYGPAMARRGMLPVLVTGARVHERAPCARTGPSRWRTKGARCFSYLRGQWWP